MSEVIEGIDINELDIPRQVKNLFILDSLGMTLEDAQTNVLSTDEAGNTVRTPVLRIPLRGMIFPSQDSADDAVLSAMGY